IVSVIVFLIVMFYACKKIELVPKKTFWAGGLDQLFEWARKDLGYNTIGPDADRHMPFLLTLLFFILTCNLVGLIPGVTVATGIIGSTISLAIISFVYFNYYGIKTKGFGKYMASFIPAGVAFPMNIFVWVIEIFSCILRLFTLAIRLFANMYAGHLILGAFAILTTVFVTPVLQSLTAATIAGVVGGVVWMVFLILMYCLELMMACIQAYVFTMLSAVYIQLATSGE
ncbi:MAG: F0F1 ATP synthase subunit A, partial [Coriobacteriales bacterium]